jgi:hypothetical protein
MDQEGVRLSLLNRHKEARLVDEAMKRFLAENNFFIHHDGDGKC